MNMDSFGHIKQEALKFASPFFSFILPHSDLSDHDIHNQSPDIFVCMPLNASRASSIHNFIMGHHIICSK